MACQACWPDYGIVQLSSRAAVRQVGLANSLLINIPAVFPLLCGFSSNNV